MNYWQGYQGEYDYRAPRPVFRIGPKLTPVVKILIVVNVVVFVITARALNKAIRDEEISWTLHLCLVPHSLVHKAALWQLLSHMFLHWNILHIGLNMFLVWMFGSTLEARLGRKRFLQLYFISGVGAGLCHTVASWGSRIPMFGASGAVFALLVAYAMLFPERYITLLLFFILPVTLKAKHLVFGIALLELLAVVSATPDGVAHYAHLGGAVFGYAFMKWKYRLGLPFAFASQLSDALKRRWFWRKRPKYRYKPVDTQQFIDREVDPILAKISRQGMSSLTRKEKRILRRARSQMK
jgi:membrane associated rhomboid family serine protease